jgi:hypothetical protein
MSDPIFTLHVICPIRNPQINQIKGTNEKFAFDTNSRFTRYLGGQTKRIFFIDDHNQWYFSTQYKCNNLREAKLLRQIARPPYLSEAVPLKLMNEMKEDDLVPLNAHYDKAFAHLSVFVDNLAQTPLTFQSKCAHIDGDDDPQIAHQLHYLSNMFNGMETRFISGWESFSFATVTENRIYYEQIHLPTVAELYLLYFVYFIHYNKAPSFQMMPRLLENLWASTQTRNAVYNKNLFKTDQIN